MTNKQQLIDEIISLEPELKNKEKELENIIETIIKTKPNFEISETFRKNLRMQLLGSNEIKASSFTKTNYMQIISWFLAWAVATFWIVSIMWITNTPLEETQIEFKGMTTDVEEAENFIESEAMELFEEQMMPEPMIWRISKEKVQDISLEEKLKNYFEENKLDMKYLKNISEIMKDLDEKHLKAILEIINSYN